jgi:hypothetical protein
MFEAMLACPRKSGKQPAGSHAATVVMDITDSEIIGIQKGRIRKQGTQADYPGSGDNRVSFRTGGY